jgi:hypothetical protein
MFRKTVRDKSIVTPKGKKKKKGTTRENESVDEENGNGAHNGNQKPVVVPIRKAFVARRALNKAIKTRHGEDS